MKVLIFDKEERLKNTGGPTGYLYNISQYLKCHPSDSIEFVDERKLQLTRLSKVRKFMADVLNSVSKYFPWLYYTVIVYILYDLKLSFTKDTITYLNGFDFIHVHSSPEVLCYFRKSKINAKIVLTTHCPEPVIDEFAGGRSLGRIFQKHPSLRDWCLRKEVRAYDVCDYVMFPVEQAREPYENASKIYKEKFDEIKNKFFYVPTSLNSTKPIAGIEDYVTKNNIPGDSFKLCYVGRHSEVKGYGFLKDAAVKLWGVLPNVCFLIGGMKDCKIGLADKRWIELGWVNTPKLLNEVDAFVLPNKNTYFDLILLEVLRQGTPVIVSKTGGNKWFESYKLDGIKFFEYGNKSELINCVKELIALKDNGKIEALHRSNREFFQKEFNMDLYIQRYTEALKKLMQK